ncbi:fatty acid amide hydrolase 1 isoform X1 [Folsomia candida]|uniref:fatty acid amide hydrolase 1 isoform X1 n=1 Tax=Folsomia candida TaxID=158441 RepID=UPI0016054F05|nr:fatty acid amide hydrolase 1 isoform X1 [Folsomia candida]
MQNIFSTLAHLCGLSTLITTSLRLSRRGCFINRQGMDFDDKAFIPAILSKSAEDQALILQALLENNLQTKSDSCCVPLAWNSQVFESKQKFRIGYISGFQSFPPIGDSQFVIGRVKSFLESAGHVFVPFDVPFDPADFLDSNSSLDCNEGVVLEKVKNLIKFDYAKSRSDVTKPDRPKKEDLIHSFLDKMNHQKIDVVISLVLPFPGISLEDVDPVDEGIMAYTLMWNCLNFPVGVVKFWNESGIHWKSSLDLLDKSGKLVWKQKLLKECANCVGMPIGVQVAGRPFQEELVLKIMVELDDINK